MEIDCDYFFLSKTALQIWRTGDINGQKRMHECIASIHKELFFKQVIFKNGRIPQFRLLEIAEEVFLTSWENFNIKGKAGEIALERDLYTGFFYTIFKRNYIKFLMKEIKKAGAEIEFSKRYSSASEIAIDKDEIFSPLTKFALNKIGENCKKLLIWKHIDCLSHDEIATKKNIDRSSSIKMVSRCGKNFLRILREHVN